MWEGSKSAVSLILGLLFLVLGGIPVLNMAGLITFALPAALASYVPVLLPYLFVVAGLMLIYDAFGEWSEWYRWVTFGLGGITLVLGLVLVLNAFAITALAIPLPPIGYNVLFVLSGLFLILGAFTQL